MGRGIVVSSLAIISITGTLFLQGSINEVKEEDIVYEPVTIEYIEEDTIEEIEKSYVPDRNDVEAIAKTLYGECRGVSSDMEKAAVAWCILNRVDAGFADSILGVVSAPRQFSGYNESHPLIPELVLIAEDVLIRWHKEKEGEVDVGRVLPPEYLWFNGDGNSNRFVSSYGSTDYWNWECIDVYSIVED